MALRSKSFSLYLRLSLIFSLISILIVSCGLPHSGDKSQSSEPMQTTPFTGQAFLEERNRTLKQIFKSPYNAWIFGLKNNGNGTFDMRGDYKVINKNDFDAMRFGQETFLGEAYSLNSSKQILETKVLAILAREDLNDGYIGVLFYDGPPSSLYLTSDFIRFKDDGNNGRIAQMALTYAYNSHDIFELNDFSYGLTSAPASAIKINGPICNNSLACALRSAIEDSKLYDKKFNKTSLINRKIELTSLMTGDLPTINKKLSGEKNTTIRGIDHQTLFNTDPNAYKTLIFPDGKTKALKTKVLASSSNNQNTFMLFDASGPVDSLKFTEPEKALELKQFIYPAVNAISITYGKNPTFSLAL